MRWLDFLFPPRSDEDILRSVSLDDFLALIKPRLLFITQPETTALLPFQSSLVRAAIHEAKYHGSAHAFTLLGSALSEFLVDNVTVGPHRSHIFVPVPLGAAREREREYNQVTEIVERAAKQLSYTIDTTLLVRTRETLSQVSLPRKERQENMRGAFRATHSADPTRTYIIVDDVITTGATLQAAIEALSAAGATHITPIALSH